MKLRKPIIWVHRWLALVAGTFWGLAALTGGVLVFQGEITQVVDAGRFETTAGSLEPGGLDRALAESFPGASVISVTWPSGQNVYSAWLAEADGSTRQVFLDGGTGQEIEPRSPTSPWLGRIRRLHTNLFLGRPGSLFVTLVSGITVFGLLTGLYLWWPGLSRLLQGLKVRLGRGLYFVTYDLHQMVGAVTVILLLIMTGTGVIMGTPGAGPRLARVFLPETPATPSVNKPEASIPTATVLPGVEAFAAAAEAATGEQIRTLNFGVNDRSWVNATLWENSDPRKPIRARLATADALVLEVLGPTDLTREQKFGSFIGTWHTANFQNLLVRILFAVACALGAVIVVTGYIVWWIKRTRRLEAARSRAESMSA